MLGFFSLIGLLRVHVLLGDFTLALKVAENVELNQKVCCVLFAMSPLAEPWLDAIHSCDSLPCHHVLLCWFLLHHAAAVPRRHPHIRLYSELYPSDETIPHTKLPVRSGTRPYLSSNMNKS